MTHLKRASVLSLIIAGFVVFVTAQSAMAVGTASSTTISNTATIDFSVGGVGQASVSSLAATFVVDNIVNLNVVSDGDATVTPGDTNVVLPFTLTNTGNTTQGYSLAVVNGTTDIAMQNIRIYLDTGVIGTLDGETAYTLGSNIQDVAADLSINVLIVADAPATATANDLTDTYSLLATTLNAGTTTATAETGGADTPGAVDVVFADNALAPVVAAGPADAATDGQHSASGIYTITSAVLAVTKISTLVSDPINLTTNPKAIPGATVTYTITVTNSGAVAASNVTVTDNIPANTTYSPGTIDLGGTSITDADGDDEGDYNITTPGAVTVVIPTIADGGSSVVEFDVTIN